MMLLYLLLTTFTITHGAKILGVIPTPSFSHQIFFRPLWRELAARGHELLILTTDPMETTSPNIKQINLHGAYGIWNHHLVNTVDLSAEQPFSAIEYMVETLYEVVDWELAQLEVQQLIHNKSEHFDLVMVEYLMPPMMAFKHRFKCPFIGIVSLDASTVGHMIMGNPTHPLLYPDPLFGYRNPNFFERIVNLVYINSFYVYYVYIYPERNDMVTKYFGEDYPTLSALSDSVDMMFINVNPVFSFNRPITPSTITLGGGMHIEKEKPLPKDLATFMNNSKNGVIYMSLGTNVKSASISNYTKCVLLEVFSQIRYDVIWKFESDELAGKPDNVFIYKWLPQQDLLRHPNIKAFITQAGLQSLEEALFSHVPILALPYFADQRMNANRVASQGIGLKLNPRRMTVEELRYALLEIIMNPEYKSMAQSLTKRVRDEPMTSVEKAIWWTEYVLRHNGTQYLKGPFIPTYQYYYLDLLTLLLIIVLLIVYLYKKICRRKQEEKLDEEAAEDGAPKNKINDKQKKQKKRKSQ